MRLIPLVDVMGMIPAMIGILMPASEHRLTFEVELIAPIAMEEKLRFAIREGGRTVGEGVVSTIIE